MAVDYSASAIPRTRIYLSLDYIIHVARLMQLSKYQKNGECRHTLHFSLIEASREVINKNESTYSLVNASQLRITAIALGLSPYYCQH